MAESTEKFFPFDGADREYKADDFARYYRAFITSGLFMNEGDNLQVTADSGMAVRVMPGAAIIDGYRYDNTGSIPFTIQAADGLLNRIDRIVIRWDKEEREIYAAVLKGTAAEEPEAPEITRNSDIIEYALADISVEAGAVSITQSDITDTRMDSDICGMALPWASLDTSALAIQYETWVKASMQSGDSAALELLKEMRDILDGTAAGHLQNEIDEEKLRSRDYRSELTVFNPDGSISVNYADDDTTETTVFNPDGSVTSTLRDKNSIAKARKTTVFNADGSIETTAELTSFITSTTSTANKYEVADDILNINMN